MSLNAIRFIIKYHGVYKAFFKIVFGQTDASLYCFPYGPTGKYFYGSQSMPEDSFSHTFSFVEQFDTEETPKLSIHQSGRVHIYYNQNEVAGPLNTMPLEDWRGQHLATVTADSFGPLAEYTKPLKNTSSEIDLSTECENGVESGRIIIYCNGEAQNFSYECRNIVKIERDTLTRPLYVGFAPISQNPLGDSIREGVTAICGWNPLRGNMAQQDFLFLRAL